MKTFHAIWAIGWFRIGACTAVICGAVAMGIFCNLSKSDWAAWVQAIGSIGAIVAAIYVMFRQNQNSVRLMTLQNKIALRTISRQNAHAVSATIEAEKRAHQRRAAAVSAVVLRAHGQLKNCLDMVQRYQIANDAKGLKRTWGAVQTVLSEMRGALVSIPAHELGSYHLVLGLHKTIESISVFIQAVESSKAIDTIPEKLDGAMEIITRNVAEASKSFDLGLAEIDQIR